MHTHHQSIQESIINTDALSVKSTCEHKTITRWSVGEIVALFEMPFSNLIYRAQTVHRENHDPNAVQVSTLISIKTGGCSEDCGYCPQAARYHTDVENEPLMQLDEVLAAAKVAKDNGASRFCMGA
ncbi:MAG TPA: biotin synthase BioB, partial [Methylophilaceae bacterium]|nr:biotin synthase BioB [Methylophilaceae bacterium]